MDRGNDILKAIWRNEMTAVAKRKRDDKFDDESVRFPAPKKRAPDSNVSSTIDGLGMDFFGKDNSTVEPSMGSTRDERRYDRVPQSSAIDRTVGRNRSICEDRFLYDRIARQLPRAQADLTDHLRRLYFLLNYSDRHRHRWIGLKCFIEMYFSIVFHHYFGPSFKMKIFHIAKNTKFGAYFRVDGNKSYTIFICINYPYWNRMVQVASALPTVFFRRSPRRRFVRATTTISDRRFVSTSFDNRSCGDAGNGGTETPTSDNAVQHDNDDRNGGTNDRLVFSELFKISLCALNVIERLEYSMADYLSNAGADHVITLSKFFANEPNARNIFNIKSGIE